MKGNPKVIDYLNKALRHELTAVNQYWLHYRLLDNWGYKVLVARLDSDRLTPQAAAELMTITPRQTYRLLRRYRDGGASAIANQRRGRPSNNRLPDVVRDHAI